MTKQVSDLLPSNKKNRKTRQEHGEYKMQTGDAIQLEICSFQTWLSSPFVQSYLRVVACVYARAQLLPKLCCLFPWIKILILNCQQYIITSVNVQLNLRMFSCCIFFYNTVSIAQHRSACGMYNDRMEFQLLQCNINIIIILNSCCLWRIKKTSEWSVLSPARVYV